MIDGLVLVGKIVLQLQGMFEVDRYTDQPKGNTVMGGKMELK